MKKAKSQVIPRMRTFDQKMQSKGKKPKVLSLQSPVPKEPFAVTLKKAIDGNDLAVLHPKFVPPAPEE